MVVARLVLLMIGVVGGMVLSVPSASASAVNNVEHAPLLTREQLIPLYDGQCDWSARAENENASSYVGRVSRESAPGVALDLDCLDREFGTQARFGSSEIRHEDQVAMVHAALLSMFTVDGWVACHSPGFTWLDRNADRWAAVIQADAVLRDSVYIAAVVSEFCGGLKRAESLYARGVEWGSPWAVLRLSSVGQTHRLEYQPPPRD
jgi:hypothetical protein